MGRKPSLRCATCRRPRLVLAVALCAAMGTAGAVGISQGQDSYARNAARLKEMTPDQKEELHRKKLRFDELTPEEQQRLRDLHTSITTDPNAKELIDTVTRYNRWLANLDPTDRPTLLDIKDPAQKIARIKELMQQQEERRFRQYLANLPEEDRKTIYKWLGEFVASQADSIRERLPPQARQRIDDAPDDEARRRELFGSWQRFRRDFNLPGPSAEDYRELFKKFSPETQKTIESAAAIALSAAETEEKNRTPERQRAFEQQRMEDLVRIALYSRFFPQISLEELLKFYAAMKPDDPRRRQLDGKEGEELRRELQRMYNWEHGGGRGGPPGKVLIRGWPGPPESPRGDGRGFRPDDRGKGADRFEPKNRGENSPPPKNP